MNTLTQSVSAYIGLGSNLANPLRQIKIAINELASLTNINLLAISSLYYSAPIGLIQQPPFINAVIKLNTTLRAEELLLQLLAIEQKQGRVRRQHWGPRIIDLDLLLYAKLTLATPRLSIPHPQLIYRNFVISPLVELNPNIRLPDGTMLAEITPEPSLLIKISQL